MVIFLLSAILCAAPDNLPLPPLDAGTEIVVQNRILTRVGGKNISVLDVMKQMDVFLSNHFPQYMNSKAAKFQYYRMQWRSTLQQMIDHELMMADAESREIKVSDGEVREEIQSRFGPNVMGSLDKLGLSYEEARKIVHQDMVVQRIQWFRVTSRALQKVTSQEIKKAYEDYVQNNGSKEEWKYQFITIRADDPDKGHLLAHNLMTLKQKAMENLSVAAELFQKELPAEPKLTVSVSQEFTQEDKALSEAHRTILSRLKIGQWSEPVALMSRDGKLVTRVFHLKDHLKTQIPPFTKLANELKQNLLSDAADGEMKRYITRLHQRFNFDENSLDIPSHFEPFSLR